MWILTYDDIDNEEMEKGFKSHGELISYVLDQKITDYSVREIEMEGEE